MGFRSDRCSIHSALQELSTKYGAERLIVLPLETTSAADYDNVKSALNSHSVNSIDILIANAGISNKNHPVDPVLSCTEEDMMNVFRTNCVGTMFTMQAFAPLLVQGNIRLCVVLSSRLASIEQTEGLGGYTSYRASKAALNMLAMTFSEDAAMKAARVKTLCMHPGWVQTDMGGSGGRKAPVSVEDSTRGIVRMIGRASAFQLGSEGVVGKSGSTDAAGNGADVCNDEFESALAKHSCVFTAFEGEMLPW
jgi:NAD(P)-dependent dehydrogenase (short-subunit alcohol dehydrogenase family)